MRKPKSLIVPAAAQGFILLDFLARQEQVSLRKAKALLDTRNVFVNGKRVWMAKHPLRAGDRIEWTGSPPPPRKQQQAAPKPDIQILWDHPRFCVVNKPAGMLSNGDDSLETILRRQLATPALQAVHRLDRDTTGCLCFAKQPAAFEEAVTWFRQAAILKIYEAIVRGIPAEKMGTIRTRIDGESATTDWQLIHAHRGAAHLRVRIPTGKTHQIRKHLASAGHPILGDRQYFIDSQNDARWMTIPRQMLHATTLEAPFEGSDKPPVRVKAPLPADFKAVLKEFGLH